VERRAKQAKRRMQSALIHCDSSPPHTLTTLLFRAGVQFFRDSIRECVKLFLCTWYGLRTVVGFKSMLLRSEQKLGSVLMQIEEKFTKFEVTFRNVVHIMLIQTL